jgi:hypothetical protein
MSNNRLTAALLAKYPKLGMKSEAILKTVDREKEQRTTQMCPQRGVSSNVFLICSLTAGSYSS